MAFFRRLSTEPVQFNFDLGDDLGFLLIFDVLILIVFGLFGIRMIVTATTDDQFGRRGCDEEAKGFVLWSDIVTIEFE